MHRLADTALVGRAWPSNGNSVPGFGRPGLKFNWSIKTTSRFPTNAIWCNCPMVSQMSGNLDAEGKVRFDPIVPGTCQVNSLDINDQEWQAA